jgi:hypothetical protein
VAGRIRSNEKSNDIGHLTCELLACSIVPQPTEVPHAQKFNKFCIIFGLYGWDTNENKIHSSTVNIDVHY